MSEQLSADRAFMNLEHDNLERRRRNEQNDHVSYTPQEVQLTPEEDQRGQDEWKDYLSSRPTFEEAGYHPVDGHLIEPSDYFDARRTKHYDETHKNPAEFSPTRLFDSYISAELNGNKTFIEDYGDALAEKLGDKTLAISKLAELQAEAEFESEVSESGAPHTLALVSEAIQKRVTNFQEAAKKRAVELHVGNLGKKESYRGKESYRVPGEDGQMRTVNLLEDAAIRTNNFRARIDRMKENYLAELHEQRAEADEQASEPLGSMEAHSAESDELDDYIPDWVRQGEERSGQSSERVALEHEDEQDPERDDERPEENEVEGNEHEEEVYEDDADDEVLGEPEEFEKAKFVSGWQMLKNRAKKVFNKAAEYANGGGEKHKKAAATALGALATAGTAYVTFVNEVKDPYGGISPEELERLAKGSS
jgi:hypothetical protein